MKRTVTVRTRPAYPVHVGPGLLAEVAAATAGCDGAAIVADEHVHELYGARLAGLEDAPCFTVPQGEATKSLAVLERVLDFLAAARLGRGACVVTLGGGVVGDLGGLAASLFKRGVAVVHAPTTLLAQVDASVGGKTAVNLAAGKNLVGTFHQPRAVLADTGTLATLDELELASGLGEVVKTALVGGEALLASVEARADELRARAPGALADVVAGCVEVKARVVAEDPLENGPRRALNLGHTFGHAIEHAAGFGRIPHGVAVAAGIGLALRVSARTGRLVDERLEERVRALCATLGLPAGLAELRERFELSLDADSLLAGMAHDKKGRVGAPELVLVRAAGELEAGVPAEPALLRDLFG